ncbi:MAG: CsgG/HfaB family protein [Candidatus Euphemobacter frigidus]|nr:CsgG/HfaB family protein [Candidatus Euphemobacter frigidus]MDP8275422.1 CsgG/HfaB family protein [Candidatus Euphemobacter frigidus]
MKTIATGRRVGWAAATVMLLLPSLVCGQLTQGKKDTLFIGAMKVQSSVRQLAVREGTELELNRVAQSLDSQFINAVSATRVFQLVNRKRIKDIQLEQAFAAVSVDPNDKNAAQTLKMSGARYAFLPQIDGFQLRTDTDVYTVGRESQTRKFYLSVQVQIVDTTTGELLPDVPSVQLNEVEIIKMAGVGKAQGSDQVLVTLARKMASRLSREVIALLRPAKVLTMTGNQIMINRGTEAGFQPGVRVEIFAVQEIIDDDTGETFRNEIIVGEATVRRGDTKKSFAEVTGENMGIAKGCIVKAAGRTAAPKMLETTTWSGGKEKAGTEVAPLKSSPETPGSSEKPLTW